MKKKRLFVPITSAFFVLSARGTAAAGQEGNSWSDVEEEKELVVVTSGTLFSVSYYNDQDELVDYGVGLAKEVAKRLNVKIFLKEYNVDGRITSILKRELGLAANGFGVIKEREKKFPLPETFKHPFNSMIARKEDDSGTHSFENPKGKKAVGEPNTSYVRLAEKHGAKLVIYDNVTDNQYLSGVANDRTDVILNDYYLQKIAVSVLPDIPVKILENVHFNESEGDFLLKERSDVLKKKIDGVLKKVKEDGTTEKVSEKYFQTDVSVKPKETMAESVSE